MALSIREKKLAVAWLAEKATVSFMAKQLGVEVTSALYAGRARNEPKILAEFNEEELKEIASYDAQIPKD